MPVRVDPAQGAEKWGRRLSGATEDIRRGVQNTTVSPGQLAARQADKWAQNTAAARQRFQTNSAAVSVEDWRNAMINKGLQRIGNGVQAAQGKMIASNQRWYPIIGALSDQVNNMPNVTIDDAIARASAFIRGMHQAKVGNAGPGRTP